MTAEIIHSPPPLSNNNNNNNNDSNPNLQELRTKLAALQHRRHLLQTTRREQEELYARLQDHHHNLQHHQHLLEQQVVEWTVRHRTAAKLLKQCPQWNALGDAFFIWHQGPFATINGIRLGAEAVVTVRNTATTTTTTSSSHEEASSSTGGVATAALGVMAATVSLPGRYLGFSSSHSAAEQPVPESANNNNNNNSTTNIPPSMPSTTTMTVRVPWTEINSALGQIVLLLHHLEQQPHSGITFPRHTLIPQGSTSKIGLRQPNAITGWRSGEIPIVAMYHLYSDDSFALFGKRNFNLALRALVECCAICANAMYARDRTMVMPFKMQVEHDNPSALCTIGGLSVQYNMAGGGGGGGGGDDNHPGLLAWTRVMKYLLTNVKWCVGFAAKHVDQ